MKVVRRSIDRALFGVVNKKGEWIINPQFTRLVYDGEYYMYKKNNYPIQCFR